MIKLNIFLICVLLIIRSSFCGADEEWTTFTTDDGLHDSVVLNIVIDANNNKYFSHPRVKRDDESRTRYLSKYDNTIWASFFIDNVTSSNGLAVDNNNVVWISGMKYPHYIVDEEVLQLGLENTDDKDGGIFNRYYYVGSIVAIAVDNTNKKWFLHHDDFEYVPVICSFDDKVFKSVFDVRNIGGCCLKDIDFDSQNRAWIATLSGLILHNYDSENWLLLTKEQGIPFESITTVTVDNENIVWIGSTSSQVNNLACLNDTTWTAYSTDNCPLPSNEIRAIEADQNNTKWIGTDAGVSRFDGETWTTFNTENSGLCDNNVNAIAVEKNNTIWFGTDNGVSRYTGEIITTSVDEENQTPEVLPKIKSYPNPFNPSTTIEFSLPQSGFTTLTIYNISGQKIKELTAEYLTAGTHTLLWNGKNDSGADVASGIYLFRLEAGKTALSHRMMLLR